MTSLSLPQRPYPGGRAKTPKLILVEGIPGSGKSSMARFAAGYLSAQKIETALYLEGDSDHPADYESLACLDPAQFAGLAARFPQQAAWLEAHAQRQGQNRLFSYRRLDSQPGATPELVEALSAFEVYEQPASRFSELILARWRAFVQTALQDERIYIFECCFLQNPLTMLLGRCNLPISGAKSLVLEMAALVQPLNPLLVYLLPQAGEALRRVAAGRPPEWLDFVIRYHTQQGYGLAQGLEGFEGLVKFYEMRQSVELSLLPRLGMHTCLVEHSDWAQDQAQVQDFLGVNLNTCPDGC